MEPVTFTKKNPCIQKIMDASTGHVTEKDCDLLADASNDDSTDMDNPVCAFRKMEYGYFVYVPCRPELDEEDEPEQFAHYIKYGYSAAFVELMILAINHDCGWINLDRDGTIIEDLPQFDW